MLLIEQTAVPSLALPLQDFKDHLRLGTGFADDSVQDALAEGYLRAAMAAIEGRIGKALIARNFLLTVNLWRDDMEQAFPLAPVSAILSVTPRDALGAGTAVAAGSYRLRKDMHRPKIAGVGGGGQPLARSPPTTRSGSFGVPARVVYSMWSSVNRTPCRGSGYPRLPCATMMLTN